MSQNNQDRPDSSYIIEYLSSVSIQNMDLSLRTKGILKRIGLKTALDIQRAIEADELITFRHVGPWTINEIQGCMRSLLENEGINRPADEINLIVNDKSKTTVMIPTIFYKGLPIDILAEELDGELINRLKSVGFKKMGELLDLSQTITDFVQNISLSSLGRLLDDQKGILQRKIESGNLHPQAQYQNMSIKAWSNLAPEDPVEQLELLSQFTQANEINSLTEELSVLFTKIRERDLEVYLKYFHENLTLARIRKQQGLSVGGVWYITVRVATRLWKQINQIPGLYLQSALLVAQNMGEQLSLESWLLSLESRQIIAPYPVRENLHGFDALCALLRSKDKSEVPPNLEIAESVISIINRSGRRRLK